jgi:hypothetical protein
MGLTKNKNLKLVSLPSFGLGLKQKPGNLPACSICGPGPAAKVTAGGYISVGQGFQKHDGAARDFDASARDRNAQGARDTMATYGDIVDFPKGLSGSGFSIGKPASCPFKLVNGLERWGAIFSSRVRPFTAANTPCNADSVTPALRKRYGPELAVIEGGKP